jgi:hypothetical protein
MTTREEWFMNPHCGPAEGPDEICGFCGRKNLACAEECTESIKEDNRLWCGGAGFWCHNCGKFYPNDSCGETYWAVEGILEVKEGFAYCSCGQKLYLHTDESGDADEIYRGEEQ